MKVEGKNDIENRKVVVRVNMYFLKKIFDDNKFFLYFYLCL